MCLRLLIVGLLAVVAVGLRRPCAAATLELVRDGKPAATIVYGRGAPDAEGLRGSAESLRNGLREALGVDRLRASSAGAEDAKPVDFPIVTDDEIMEGSNWRLKPEWLGRPLILLGNVANNRAQFALFSQFLEGANASYPGPGCYVLRVLFQPFRRGTHLLVLGASDAAGLNAGIARLKALASANHGALGPTIELGNATGPTSKPTQSGGDFIWCVEQFYWYGDLGAGQRARELLMAEASKPAGGKSFWGFKEGGHYDWERYYRPLRRLLASGLLSEEERGQVESCLLAIALESQDWAGLTALQAPPGGMTNCLTRHPISGLIGHYIVYEYLANVGDVPPEKRAAIAKGYALLRGHIESLIEDDRFMSNEVGTQGMDNLSFIADMYLQLGDARVVERGILRRMAGFYLSSKDSLGFQVGDDAYITCRPGCHRAYSAGGLPLLLATYFHHDGQYRWLLENTHHFMSHMQVPQPPEIKQLASAVPPEPPDRYRGLTVVPMDPWWHRRCSGWKPDEMMVPVAGPPEKVFAKAAFRDGYDRNDAYLLLQGLNLGAPAGGEGFSANSVARYMEFGSLLLFANTIKQTSWARSLVSASRGQADPQGIACVLGTQFTTPRVSGLESIQESEGGTSWSRSIVHRNRGYFVVLDTLTAKQEDTYNLTCRWRSFHSGGLIAARHFEAADGMLGVRFHLLGTTPAAWDVEEERIDGASRPTMIRQFKRVHLKGGETTSFHNLMYACNRATPRAFEARPFTGRGVLVRGKTPEFEELAGIGTGPLSLGAVTAQARLWYVSAAGLVISGARQAKLGNLLEVEAQEEISLGLEPGNGSGWIENPLQRPVTLKVRTGARAALRLDGQPLGETASLSPGRHRLDCDAGALFRQLAQQLPAAWAASHPAPPVEAPALEVREQFEFSPAWTSHGVAPEHRRYGNVLTSAEPPVQIGEVDNWRNRMVCPPSGYGWHGSDRAGWLPGTQGTIVLDLGKETDVQEVRLVRSRRAGDMKGVFRPDEFSFEVELSNDGFQRDTRRRHVDRPGFDVFYSENQHYMYTMRFPVFVVPIGERARQIKVTPRRQPPLPEASSAGYTKAADGTYSAWYQDTETSFSEIEVVAPDREARIAARLWCGNFGATDGPKVIYQAGTHLMMLSADGKPLWDRDLGGPLAAAPVLADLDGDGRQEILTYTLGSSDGAGEQLAAHDLAGKATFSVDVLRATGVEESSGLCSTRPACLAAWRPNAERQLEYIFFPHYKAYRVSSAPELAVRPLEHASGNRGGKFAFTVPDVTGDGREELAVVGLYGFCFGVIPSEAPLEQGQLPAYRTVSALTGYSSGNQEMSLYHDGAVVRDRSGAWLGVVTLNPGGLDFFNPGDFTKRWGHFNHPPNACFVLHDLNGDGKPEVLVGREDGYVVAYEIEKGEVVARTALDGAVQSLAVWQDHVVAGTERGLTLLDSALRPVAHQGGAVESVAVLAGASGPPLIVAAHSNGDVSAYRLTEAKGRQR